MVNNNEILIIEMPDYLDFFLRRYAVDLDSTFYVALMEALISLAKATMYDISGNDIILEKYNEMCLAFGSMGIPVQAGIELTTLLRDLSGELLSYFVANNILDKVIYHVETTNKRLVFNSYRM